MLYGMRGKDTPLLPIQTAHGAWRMQLEGLKSGVRRMVWATRDDWESCGFAKRAGCARKEIAGWGFGRWGYFAALARERKFPLCHL